MSLVLTDQPTPLASGLDGVVRIGATRVTLDTVIAAFHDGASPESIADQYPSLTLADVYSVIGYYLYHQVDVDSYLAQRRQVADKARRENEARFDPNGVRNRLQARQRGQG